MTMTTNLIPAIPARSLRHASAILAGVFLLASCSDEKATKVSVQPDALAVVSGTVIDEETYRRGWAKSPQTEDSPSARSAVLEKLIERRALFHAAQAQGLEDDPIVREQIENILIGRLREIRVTAQLENVQVDEEEVRRTYETQSENYTQPAQTRVAMLWIDTRGQSQLEDRYTPRLEAIREELLDTPDSIAIADGFGPHAFSNSEHRSSRTRGGDLGWIRDSAPADPFQRVIYEIASGLRTPGELSAVECRPEGTFLLRLIERQAERTRSFESVRARIKADLVRERRRALEADFVSTALDGADIQRFGDRLTALPDLPLTRGTAEFPPAHLTSRAQHSE